jgi:hypothetical protein
LIIVSFVVHLLRSNTETAQAIWKSSFVLQKELPVESALLDRILKDCLPGERTHCNTFIPVESKTQRVAVLSPPGLISKLLQELVNEAAQAAATDDYEFIHTSHVPP